VPKKPLAPPTPLTGKQRSHLRSLAHPLKPVVQIGRQGLTAGVLGALRVAFERHELIKVKLAGDAEVDPEVIAPEIERATRAQLAQIIGHTLVLYRRHDSEPKIVLPRPSKTRKPSAPAEAPTQSDDDDEEEEG